MTKLTQLIAKLRAIKSCCGEMEVRLQGARMSDGSCDLDRLEVLVARGHPDPAKGLIGDLKNTAGSVPVLVVLNKYADLRGTNFPLAEP